MYLSFPNLLKLAMVLNTFFKIIIVLLEGKKLGIKANLYNNNNCIYMIYKICDRLSFFTFVICEMQFLKIDVLYV